MITTNASATVMCAASCGPVPKRIVSELAAIRKYPEASTIWGTTRGRIDT